MVLAGNAHITGPRLEAFVSQRRDSKSVSANSPRRILLMLIGAAALALAGVTTASTASAATSLPCDIYGAAGTPCVAAHSTTRALYGSYNGPLYQVQRASDSAKTNIGLLAAGGYANAAAQDSFCAGTTCLITEI